MKTPKAKPRSSGTVPIGVASGLMYEDRSVVTVPWTRASVLHRQGVGHFENPVGVRAEAEKVQIDPARVEAHEAMLPKPVRRNQRMRAQALATDLFEIGLKSQRMFGYPVWPRSLQQDLDRLGQGKADLYTQVEALTTFYMRSAENERREADAKATVRGWHGHLD